MEQSIGVSVDNATYLSLARIEAIKGDAEAALAWVGGWEG